MREVGGPSGLALTTGPDDWRRRKAPTTLLAMDWLATIKPQAENTLLIQLVVARVFAAGFHWLRQPAVIGEIARPPLTNLNWKG